MTTPKTIITHAENFIRKYVTLKEDYHAFPLALWAIHTHCWDCFDVTPYLVITKPVRRAGGTRLMETIMYLSANAHTFSPDSPAAMMRTVLYSDVAPSCFIDEAEKFNENNHPAREFLNKGYRRGQTIPKVINGKPIEMETYCPKCFVLIGDVYSTLRDRTITVVMRRRTPVESASSTQFRMSDAKEEGAAIRDDIAGKIDNLCLDIKAAYTSVPKLSFLNDRDEETWQPLFALAMVLCPDRVSELKRIAVDMATEKQTEARKESKAAERQADKDDNKVLLLRDMLRLSQGKRGIATTQLVEQLKGIETAPWRKYQGRGITDADIAELLESLYLRPKTIRVSNNVKVTGSTLKGYRRDDLEAAAKLVEGLMEIVGY